MSTPLDHHYVPRCFFKPWEINDKKVVTYQKKNGLILPPYKKSTKSICVHRNLYSYTASVEEAHRNSIEQKLLSKIDNDAAKILQKFQGLDGIIDLPDKERFAFSAFIISLRLRTPEAFKVTSQGAGEHLKELLLEKDSRLEEEEAKSTLNGQTLLEWAEKNHTTIMENYGKELVAKLFISDKFVVPVMQMNWIILKRDTETTNLLSSDRPLVLLGNLKSANVGFALTISPNRVFIATSKPESIHKLVQLPHSKFIKEMNASTIQQAKDSAFAVDDRHSIRFFENRLGVHHNILPWT